jgi:hypothetical protein
MPDSAILFRLGLVKEPFNSDLRAAAAETQSAGVRMGQGFFYSEAAQGRLFTSSHRAARQIGLFTQQLTTGADAGTLFASAIERAERVLRLPLGSLAALAAAGILLKEFHDVAVADEKLRAQLEKSIKPSAVDDYKAALEDLQKRIKDTATEVAKAQQRIEAPTFIQRVADIGSNIFTFLARITPGLKTLPDETGGRYPTDIAREQGNAKIREAQQQNQLRLAIEIQKIRESGKDVEKRIFDVRIAAAESERDAIKEAFKGKRPDLEFEAQTKLDRLRADAESASSAAEIAKSLNVAEKAAAGVAQSISEKAKLSLAELAKEGDQTRTGFGTAIGVGAKARDAQREEELARRAALRGNEAEAIKHETRAEQIKATIGTLRDSEKLLGNQLKSALDSSAKISKIEENTRAQFIRK